MNFRTMLCVLVTLIIAVLSSVATISRAAPPWEKLFSTSRVDADPDKAYKLTEQNGPWMIMTHSLSGDGAEDQARELVLELRKKYKLPAYVHRMKFEFGDAQGQGVDRFGGAMKMRYQRGSEREEFAVLVGNYPRVDHPDAQKTLKEIKFMQPDCLKPAEGKKINSSLGTVRMVQKMMLPEGSDKKKKGPLGSAFVTSNPMLPADYFAQKGPDEFILKLNDGVQYSLLDCPGRYSVQVAQFTGKVVINQKEIAAISHGDKSMESRLADAAEQAHRLTLALRKKGYEAYEFHDRSASIVTIGSFNEVGTPRADGKTEIHPKIHTIMRTFGAEAPSLPGQPAGAMEPKTISDGKGVIALDVQPIPVQVPKRSFSATLARGRELQ
jgi:hypothetical protein